jgi:hypothetical protein
MANANSRKNRLHLHYSPTAFYSIGLVQEDERGSDRYNTNLQLNNLLFRRNTKESQANLYLMSAAGIATENEDQALNLDLSLAGDWETRRYFSSFILGGDYADTIQAPESHQTVRFGIAPYLANSGALHTWLMIQFEHHPEENNSGEKFLITPILRLFKGPVLGELGMNQNSDLFFQLIYRH